MLVSTLRRLPCVRKALSGALRTFSVSRFGALCWRRMATSVQTVMGKEKAEIRKNMRMTPEEESVLLDAMQRDGMSQLTTWMKWVCRRYATGQLVPAKQSEDGDDMTELRSVLLRVLSRVDEVDERTKP